MKRLAIISLLIVFVSFNGQGARVITNFDIARWYLDSDLVLICSVDLIDTINISHHDSYTEDSLRLTYDMIREIYHITVDSIIKSTITEINLIDSICSQDFSINYAKTMESESIIYKVNEQGDTVGTETMGMITMFGTDL